MVFRSCCICIFGGKEGRKKRSLVYHSVCMCVLHAEKDASELGKACVYPQKKSLFAVGKCFMLKDLLTKVILLVMRA